MLSLIFTLFASQALSQTADNVTVSVNTYGNSNCTGTAIKTFDLPAEMCISGTDLYQILALNDSSVESILSKFSAKPSCGTDNAASFVVYSSTNCTGSFLPTSGLASSGNCTSFPGVQTGVVVNGTALTCKRVNSTSTSSTASTASATATDTNVVNGAMTENGAIALMLSSLAALLFF